MDSEFGTCLRTRRSVSVAIVTLAKGAVSWQSRMQGVSASGTSEAEYAASSEAVRNNFI